MPYDDDDDLFNHEFDFVDDDDDDVKEKAQEEGESKSRRRGPAPRGRKDKVEGGEKADKPASRGPKRAGPARPRRNGGRGPAEQKPAAPAAPIEPAPVGYLMGDVGDDDIAEEPSEIETEAAAPAPAGPPADHVVHIYEYGAYKRTVNRKFTDEEAVSFAEEFTRTGKAYGRYAIATPEDEEPAPTFAGAAKG
ncbi:MAG TPA: hypothetical protein VF175_15245 [Lacipirellula sp.]